MALLNTSDELLEALARNGGVVVSTSTLTAIGIAQARACGRMYVNASGLGFVLLQNCVAHPNLPDKEACGM
jgi:hypothetical protein